MTESVPGAHEPSVTPGPALAPPTAQAPIRSDEPVCIDGGGLIAQFESDWFIQVGREQISLPAATPAEIVARRFIQLQESVKGSDRRCILGLTGAECFFTDFEPPAALDIKDRPAVTFELERHFPLDAESMVADYCYHASSGCIAATAIETERHRATVDALEAAGVDVVSIIPTSVLVARAARRHAGESSSFTLLLFDSDSAETLSVDPDGVYQWRRFVGGDEELFRHHAVVSQADDTPQTFVIVGKKELAFRPAGPVLWCNQNATRLAAESAGVALGGRWGRWPDFRRGALAPSDPLVGVAGHLRKLALAASLCFVLISVAAWYRESRLASESESVRQQQRAAFGKAYPDRRVPVMLMRSVRSEHSKVLGSRGRGDAIQLPIPATTVLRDLFRGLQHAQTSGNVRFRLMNIDIQDGECAVTVRALDAVQIGTIALSLESVGFEVQPPASEQIDPSKNEPLPTYQSTIEAQWHPKADVPNEGAES